MTQAYGTTYIGEEPLMIRGVMVEQKRSERIQAFMRTAAYKASRVMRVEFGQKNR